MRVTEQGIAKLQRKLSQGRRKGLRCCWGDKYGCWVNESMNPSTGVLSTQIIWDSQGEKIVGEGTIHERSVNCGQSRADFRER